MTSKVPPSQSAPETDGNEAEPASTSWIEQPETVRRLQILVIALGAVLILGFATVIGRIAYLALQPAETTVADTQKRAQQGVETPTSTRSDLAAQSGSAAGNGTTEFVVSLPEGATVKSMSPVANGILVHIDTGGQTEALVIDTETGAIKSRFRFTPDK